jgi:LmbE family N-acetylglucosaminyl deacetylase
MNDEQASADRAPHHGHEMAPDVAGAGSEGNSSLALPAGPVLVVAAHPDDADIGCGGTMARLVAEGRRVVVAVVTDGSEGGEDPSMADEELRDVRENEQRAALAELGVTETHFSRYPDGRLEATLHLRLKLTRLIRQVRPATVFVHDPTAHLFEGYINHPDHRVSGAVTLDAVFPSAGNPRAFRELLSEGLSAHKVSSVYLFYTANANAWIDIGGSPLDQKIAALSHHRSQLGAEWDGATWLREEAEREGKPLGLAAAEGFRRINIGN